MAADVFFSTNPADWAKLEGLYISERNPPGFIRGVDLSVVAIGGVTVRGPSGPQSILSTGRFLEVYGGRDYGSGGPLINQVWAALLNKQYGALVIERIIAADATISSFDPETLLDGTGVAIIHIAASSAGVWGENVKWKVESASDGTATKFNVVISYLGEEVTYENLNTNGALDDNTGEVVGDDIGRFVTITKLANGRPVNSSTVTEAAFVSARDANDFVNLGAVIVAYTSVAGTEGTIASAQELAVVTSLGNYEGPTTVLMAGVLVDQNALNAQLLVDAALRDDRMWLTWAGTHGQSVSAEISNLATDLATKSDRIVWCFNSAYTLDPDTALAIQRPPHEWMGSIFSQNDVDVHPGAQVTSKQTAGISRVTNEALTRTELIALKAAGIATLERLPGQFLFRSGITTDLTTGKTEIARRRMADFLQLSAADRLRFYVKAKNTIETRAVMAGELTDFSRNLRDEGRIIEEFEISSDVNKDSDRANGIEKLLWRVDLVGHILSLVLETEIGTGVVIEA